uniref:Uncharacterized protein n=1 Tax=Octactis speculum TaxID=3111310 RepID=A0A7S2G882_9STRA|mmetsp:Transcript_39293/g.53284  ORF Transcript_39293/g.53284 Transcript_39293/m.53284 type:complete len:266 (+) Transcript_39293:1-798(+)
MLFDSRVNYEKYVSRLRAIPTQLAQVCTLLRLGISTGVLPPAVSLEGVPDQLNKTIAALEKEGGTASSYWHAPPPVLEQSDPSTKALGEKASSALSAVRDAFCRLLICVEEEYMPAIASKRDGSVACADLPNGAAMYEECLRFHTGSSKTAEDIHETGKAEVNRISREMKEACLAAGMEQGGSVKEFLEQMQQDPQFTSPNSQAHVDKYRALCMRILPELPKLFSIRCMPRTPFAVVPTPDAQAEAAPGAFYLGIGCSRLPFKYS